MPCSPYLKGVTDPLQALRIISKHPVLCYSEPPRTFSALAEKGWTTYERGGWRITTAGRDALTEAKTKPQTLTEFFDL